MKQPHEYQIAMPAKENVAVQSKKHAYPIEFRDHPCSGAECALRCGRLLLAQERFVHAPAHARENFFQFSAQPFACGRICFINEERKSISTFAGERLAKSLYVSIKVGAIARFSLVNK